MEAISLKNSPRKNNGKIKKAETMIIIANNITIFRNSMVKNYLFP